MEPSRIYDLDDEVLAGLRARGYASDEGPVLVHLVRGFLDAGSAAELAAQHLTTEFERERLVTFDIDQLLDYRARRPAMTFDVNRWVDYAAPELVIDVVADADGVPFLLLHGMEPDVQWERWISAVRGLVERLGVPTTIGMYGIPMGVPHTRPTTYTAHATRPELVAHGTSWFGTVQVPASASTLLEYRLGQVGHDAIGLAVHVPHYLSQSPFPQAAVAGMRGIERLTGLNLAVDRLDADVRETAEEIERQVSESAEVGAVVEALEQQYDAFHRATGRSSLLVDEADLPSADELGAQFERFLAEQRQRRSDGSGA